MPNTQFYTFLDSFFSRIGIWFLNHSTLAEFACNRELPDNSVIKIGMLGVTPDLFLERCKVFGIENPSVVDSQIQIKMVGVTVIVDLYQPARKGTIECNGEILRPEWIVCPKDVQDGYKYKNIFTTHGTCRLALRSLLSPDGSITTRDHFTFPIPWCTGRVLDTQWPEWFKNIKHLEPLPSNNIFFDEPRCACADELLREMLESAEEAGIRKWAYPGFGTMLGIVRDGNYIQFDRDMDLCFDADQFTLIQMDAYYQTCSKRNLFKFRERKPTIRTDNGKYLWTSIGGYKHPIAESGVHSCNWFCFRYEDYIAHSKGSGLWVDETKFRQRDVHWTPQDQDICKLFAYEPFSKFTTMNFHDIEINIPIMAGWCLDEMYPNWSTHRPNKSSAHTTSLIIGDWCKHETWRMG